jgi:hypothetical protein
MSPQDEGKPGEEQKEEVGVIDPRRGAVPTVASEDETGVDTRDLESDRNQSDETDNKSH